MLPIVAEYLKSKGLGRIYVDYLPAVPTEAAGLFCWEHLPPAVSDGTSVRYVQVRVRGADVTACLKKCARILALLDSGADERPLPLNYPGVVIGRPRRLPAVLNRDAACVTVTGEIALWGMIEEE